VARGAPGALAGATSRCGWFEALNVTDHATSSMFFSQNLNTSAQIDE
jgi:hypothetical protein